jgi:hypothetical protein
LFKREVLASATAPPAQLGSQQEEPEYGQEQPPAIVRPAASPECAFQGSIMP